MLQREVWNTARQARVGDSVPCGVISGRLSSLRKGSWADIDDNEGILWGEGGTGVVAEILGHKHNRFAWTGVQWAESADGRMDDHAHKQWLHLVLHLMRWRGTSGFQGERRAVPALWGWNALGSVRAFTGESRVFQGRCHQQKWRGVDRANRDGIVTRQCRSQKSCSKSEQSAWAASWWARSDGTWGRMVTGLSYSGKINKMGKDNWEDAKNRV